MIQVFIQSNART